MNNNNNNNDDNNVGASRLFATAQRGGGERLNSGCSPCCAAANHLVGTTCPLRTSVKEFESDRNSELNDSDPDVSIYNSLFQTPSTNVSENDNSMVPDESIEQENDPVDVEIMTHIKMWTEKLPSDYHNDDFKQISDLVQQYLKKYCLHCIVRDEIDIDPDVSRTIYYCSKCFCSF